jgi:hypothetical protein
MPSIAVLPPPTTATRVEFAGPVRLHQVHASQKFVRGINPAKVLAGDAEEVWQPRAGGDEHGIITFLAKQLVHGHGLADNHVGLKLDAHPPHVLDFLPDDLLRQTEFRDAVNQHAADFVQRLQHAHFVSLLNEVTGAAQSCRTAADNGDFLAGRWGDGR